MSKSNEEIIEEAQAKANIAQIEEDYWLEVCKEAVVLAEIAVADAVIQAVNANLEKAKLLGRREVVAEVQEWLEKECNSGSYETETRNPYGSPAYISEDASWAITELKDKFKERFCGRRRKIIDFNNKRLENEKVL